MHTLFSLSTWYFNLVLSFSKMASFTCRFGTASCTNWSSTASCLLCRNPQPEVPNRSPATPSKMEDRPGAGEKRRWQQNNDIIRKNLKGNMKNNTSCKSIANLSYLLGEILGRRSDGDLTPKRLNRTTTCNSCGLAHKYWLNTSASFKPSGVNDIQQNINRL